MNIKKIAAAVLCMLILSACGTAGNAVTPDSAADTSSALSDTLSKTDIPEIREDFTGNDTSARNRGSAVVQLIDDTAASDGRAMFISGRQEAWNGAEYPAELFRGNDIEVSGSFKSSNVIQCRPFTQACI